MKKKICFVKWVVNEVDGGLKVAVNLANELSEKYEIHLLSIFSTREVFFELNEDVYYQTLSKEKLSMTKDFFKAVKLLRSYVIENNISILFGIGITMNTVGVVGTLGLKTKFVSCDHTNSISNNRTWVQKVQRYVGAYGASKIITLTEKDRLNYLSKYKISLTKIDYIHNWIEYIDVKKDYLLDSKKLITVGRFCHEKGYDYLVKVAKEVLAKNPDWEWDIYGTGDEKIKHQLMEFNKGRQKNKVNLMGNVKGIDNIYPGHGIYIMTSRSEGLPLVLLEAKIFGLPIVSFDCPTGPSEIVLDGVNGYLIDNYDIDIMSEKIQNLIDNKDLRLEFSRNSMMGTEKFNKEQILQKWISLIEEMIGGK
ncbi:glycosyltransferase family 4 protein [Gemella sp.]